VVLTPGGPDLDSVSCPDIVACAGPVSGRRFRFGFGPLTSNSVRKIALGSEPMVAPVNAVLVNAVLVNEVVAR
jgi:hypothetical protein